MIILVLSKKKLKKRVDTHASYGSSDDWHQEIENKKKKQKKTEIVSV